MRLIDAKKLEGSFKRELDYFERSQITYIQKKIRQAPTIEVFTLADIEKQYRRGLERGLEEAERSQGKWINLERRKGQLLPFWRTHKCSVCSSTGQGEFNFCPNCGAKMKI